MEDYIFVCIGTNQLVPDSFGPRVGDFLEENFQKNSQVKIFGTMQTPVHFQNAPVLLRRLKRIKDSKIILIDSAFAKNEMIGSTYVNFGGVEIGKAFGRSLYFPAHLNIKTVVENEKSSCYLKQINLLAQGVATKIIETIYNY